MKKSFITIMLTSTLVVLSGCQGTSPEAISSDKTQLVVAEIIDHTSGALHIDYTDGSWTWFDETSFRIIAPKKWNGRELNVMHNEPEGSIWVKEKTIVTFSVILDELDWESPWVFNGIIAGDLKER